MDDLQPFESSNILMAAARAARSEFEVNCTEFLQNNSYDEMRHTDPNTREQVIKLRFQNRIPPTLRYKASSIINDTRHTLDQAVCDAALLLGFNGQLRKLYFPIGSNQKELNDRIHKLKKDGVRDDLADFLGSFDAQPGGNNDLYCLSTLAGQAKHQKILRISNGDSGAVIDGSGSWSITGPVTLNIRKWNDLRNELEFARVGVGGSFDARIGVDTYPILEVVLFDGAPPYSGPAPLVLDRLIEKTSQTLTGIIETTFHLAGISPQNH